MKIVRWFALVAVLGGLAVLSPSAEAGEPVPIPYTCRETTDPLLGVSDINADIVATGSAVPSTAKIFQPVTWTFDLEEPELLPPLAIALHYLRIRLPIPEHLVNVRASAVAAVGETPNPALNQISVAVVADEVVLQIPTTPSVTTRIRANTNGTLTYPTTDGQVFPLGNPVVLPLLKVTGTPTPSAGGATVDWLAPDVDAQATVSALGGDPTLACTPDADPAPAVATTSVLTTRQLCDGKPVTVQLGFNTPTQGADVIQGTAANDTTNGLGGGDRFCGLAGADTFNGGGGNDRALGGAGNDRLRGDAGDDRLQGDAGDDNLQGGANRDALIGGANRDTCNGGPQNDTATTCEVRQSIP